jgi:hypothetical protein
MLDSLRRGRAIARVPVLVVETVVHYKKLNQDVQNGLTETGKPSASIERLH